MKTGKLPNSLLKAMVLDKLKPTRKEVLLGPGIGEDCCALDFGENACVLTVDPITGAAHEVGRLAVHIACNDLAACGVKTLGLLVVLMAPAGSARKDTALVINQISETARSLKVDIIGGHTEITNSVNRFVVVVTAVGKILKGKLVSTAGAQPGDDIIMTKTAGLEGTAIIARDKAQALRKVFGPAIIKRAQGFIHRISVIREGIIAGKYGVNAMHDATEGGILGAVWELAEASGRGIVISKARVPIEPETVKICRHYALAPLKLISSGSMLITCPHGGQLVGVLKKAGIQATLIGKVQADPARLLSDHGRTTNIGEPETDELFRIIG